MLKVLQTSDLHFGPKDLADKIRCFEELLATARDWRPDLAAIPGDIYDHALRLEDEAAVPVGREVRLMRGLLPRRADELAARAVVLVVDLRDADRRQHGHAGGIGHIDDPV